MFLERSSDWFTLYIAFPFRGVVEYLVTEEPGKMEKK